MSAIESVAVGDAYECVISILGAPAYEHDMVLKDQPIDKGRVLYYVLEQHNPRDLNAKCDRYVAIYIDRSGKVIEILKNNLK